MDLGPRSDADLLERALEGERVDDSEIGGLVAVARAVAAMPRSALDPRPEFVADLRSRILSDAGLDTGLDTRLAGRADEAADDQTGRSPVSVLRLAGRPLRFAAAAAAALVVAAGTLGLASRSALPGDALYGIKQVLDRAAVGLAGSRLDEGLTHLAQAEQHIAEARDLVDRGDPAASDVDTALDAAAASTSRAQTLLLEVYRVQRRGDALTDLADFYARALPQVDALRDRVPPASRPAWQRLHDLLVAGRDATLRELAACPVCGDAAARARAALAPPTLGPAATAPAGATATGTPAPTSTDGVSVAGGISLPGVGAPSDSIGVGGGGATLPGGTVNLPSLGVTSSTLGVGGGGVTLPGPLPTVSLPSASLTAPDLSGPSLLP